MKTETIKVNNIAGFDTAYDFFSDKVRRFSESEKSFETLFDFMFSEKDNLMAETYTGLRTSKVTYGEAEKQILKLAPALRTLIECAGVKSSSKRAGIYMANSVLWIEVMWALLMNGYAPVFLNLSLGKDTVEHTIEEAETAFVVTDGEVFPNVPCIKTEDIKKELEKDHGSFKPVWADEICFLSSGTSGTYKVCAYNGQRMFSQICYVLEIFKKCPDFADNWNGDIKLLALLPFYHIFGLSAIYFWLCFPSRSMVFVKDMNPDLVRDAVRTLKVTHIFCVPVFWETIRRNVMRRSDKVEKAVNGKGLFRKAVLKKVRAELFGDSVKFGISGGGAISSDTLKFFNALGYRLVNGYGMTETGITAVELSSDKKVIIQGSIGGPLEGCEYKLENGKLLVRNNGMAVSVSDRGKTTYYKEPDWFDTGDLAYEKDGKYWIKGRADELLVLSNGENLHPAMIEAVMNHRFINNCALIQLQDSTLALIVLLVPGLNQNDIRQVRQFVEARIADCAIASRIKLILSKDDVPVSAGKTARPQILEAYLAGNITPVEVAEEKGGDGVEDKELVNTVTLYFARALDLPPEQITYTGDFFRSYNGGSLDYFALLSSINLKFGMDIKPEKNGRLSSVRDFCKYIRKQKK